MKLKGKVAIITGAGAGIGEASALLFGKEGAKICCNSITTSSLDVAESIKQNGGDVIFIQGDVSKEEVCKNIVEETIRHFKQLDILFNNAGIVIPGGVDTMTPDEWDRTMEVNIRSIFLMSRFSLPYLRKTKGTIINTGSSVAIKGVKNRAAYTASKGAVLSMTRAMAIDYMEDGIRVNCISPGTTDTPSLTKRLAQFDDPVSARKKFIARQPMKRLGTSEEIAEGVLYLVLAEFCTGISLSVDGGMTA
jgi:NAD(P)-dependent dehydrogenase (short-subunit alcohol dehydrogenase family)